MTTRVALLQPDQLPQLTRFTSALWNRSDPGFLRWRFFDHPGIRTWVAWVGDDIGALLSVMTKRYRIAGEEVEVGEIFDWASAPEFRGKGLGVSVVQAAMKEGRPLFTLGGSEDTLRLLPRLKWRSVADGRVYALPLRGALVRDRLAPRGRFLAAAAGVAFEAVGRVWFRPRSEPGTVERRSSFDEASLASIYRSASGFSIVAALDGATLSWAEQTSPGAYLRFASGPASSPSGIGLARVVEARGRRTGEICELFVSDGNEAMAVDLIAAMVRALAVQGVQGIISTASAPLVQKAFRRNRFIGGHAHPWLAWFPDGRFPPPGPAHVMRATADHLYFPAPSSPGG